MSNTSPQREGLADLQMLAIPEGTVDWPLLAQWITEPRSNPHTCRAYATDLATFFIFLAASRSKGQEGQCGEVSVLEALQWFLSADEQASADCLVEYRRHLETEFSPTTVHRRLRTLSTLVRWAQMRKIIPIRIRRIPTLSRPALSEPAPRLDKATLQRLLTQPGTGSLRGLRDTALLRLLAETGLHRGEVCALRVGDFLPGDASVGLPRLRVQEDNEGDTSAQGAAGRAEITSEAAEKEEKVLSLSQSCASALEAYLAVAEHGQDPPAALFQILDHRLESRGGGLTPQAVYKIVTGYGRAIGAKVTPRSLRRTAIKGPKPTSWWDQVEGDQEDAEGPQEPKNSKDDMWPAAIA